MVLVEGAGAGGVTVDQDGFDVAADSSAVAAADQVAAVIVGTRENAAQGGYRVTSSGVSCTDPARAAALRDTLAARRIENVMLVSAVTAAAALAQAVGSTSNWSRTALLLVEPSAATLAVVDSRNGQVTDARRHPLPAGDDAALARLTAVVAGVESLPARPDGVLLVGSEVDIPAIKPTLDAATSLSVMTPEEPEMALARGASMAAANASLGAPRTVAMPATQLQPAAAPQLAYTAEAPAGPDDDASDSAPSELRSRKRVLAIAAVTAVFVVGVVALVLAVTVGRHSPSDPHPDVGRNVVAPAPPPQNPAPPAPVAPPPAPVTAPQAPPSAPPTTTRSDDHQRIDDWLHRHLG